jgi:hypothetical protein
MTLKPGSGGEHPVGRVYGGRAMAKSTWQSRPRQAAKIGQFRASGGPNCHYPEPVGQARPKERLADD